VNAKTRKYRFLLLVGLSVTTLGVGAITLVRNFLQSSPGAPKLLVQEIHLIRPPPPPPDLPPPPPPPPEEKVDIPDPQKPDPTPSNEPPPSERLGLDAEGSAGGDAFGLAAREGGRDLLASGGSALTWYASLVKNEILEQLSIDKRVHGGAYSVPIAIWVRSDGTVERVRLAESTGDRERDRAIEADLARITRIPQPPPAGAPQPITFRMVSHG
jgi:protein TonB